MTSNKYNYWCENCTCGKIGKERDFIVEKSESKENRKEFCPNDSKLLMKLMGVKTHGAKIMDKTQRVSALKKRSKDHYNREIKEKKAHMIKRFDQTGHN